MKPAIEVRRNQHGNFVEVYADYFDECIEYAYQKKVPQIHITSARLRENKNPQVDFTKLEMLSDSLEKIAIQTTLENAINTESIYALKNLNSLTGEKQKFALDLSRFKNLKHYGGEYWKKLLIDEAFSLTSAVLRKLPDADLQRISGLKNMETLHVYRSKIQSLDGIQKLPLKVLRLVSCNSLENIDAIKELKMLERLNIEKCKKAPSHEFIKEPKRPEMDIFIDGNKKVAEKVLDNLPALYEKGKTALFNSIDSNELIKNYIHFHIAELDELHEFFGVDSNAQITAEMFIEKLAPKAIAISTDNENIIDCSLDFSLSEDFTDELLVVRFNNRLEIYEITHEN
jgi:internalin A